MNFVSFSQLGRYGRLGNQIFQVAATLSLAKDKGIVAGFPKSVGIHKIFNLDFVDLSQIPRPNSHWKEAHFHYDKSIDSVGVNTNITGYLQAEKYFVKNKEYILEQLSFSQETIDKSLSLLPLGEKIGRAHV